MMSMVSMEWPQLPARYFTSSEACSCPDWAYRGRYRPCKHIKALREALAVLDANTAKWAMQTIPSSDGIVLRNTVK